MQIPLKSDVVIIGGGPAGSTAATLLARKGYDVVLLEKQKHPRFTVGESLLPHAWRFLDILGATEIIEQEGFIAKRGGTVVWDDKIYQVSFSDFGYKRPGLHVERDRFDYLLLEHSRNNGAQIFEKVAVTSVNLDDVSAPVVHYRDADSGETGAIAARFVVDASGQNALLARQMDMRVIDEDYRFVAMWGYFRGGKYVARDGRAHDVRHMRENPPTTYIASCGDWGWGWHIPMRESTSVSMIMNLEKFKQVKKDNGSLENYFLDNYRSVPYFEQLLDSADYIPGSFHTIRDYSYVPKKLTGPGYYLLGDAAAFVDPIFSLGVVIAMYSGNVAAWAIDRTFRNPESDVGSRKIYDNQFTGFYELARAMAIPGRPIPPSTLELANRFVQFQSDTEQDLLYVATLLTCRDHNFESVVTQNNSRERVMQKCDILDAIGF